MLRVIALDVAQVVCHRYVVHSPLKAGVLRFCGDGEGGEQKRSEHVGQHFGRYTVNGRAGRVREEMERET